MALYIAPSVIPKMGKLGILRVYIPTYISHTRIQMFVIDVYAKKNKRNYECRKHSPIVKIKKIICKHVESIMNTFSKLLKI